MISASSKGDFKKTERFLRTCQSDLYSDFSSYGRIGVDALASATPIDSGLTAHSWGFNIIEGIHPGIEWFNDNTVNGTPVAILIQYGHGTGTGGYVQGRDFINPAIQPIFDKIADDVWKKVMAA